MRKKRNIVYKKTTVRDKRSFLRSLDLFTKNNNEAFIENTNLESLNEITFYSPLNKLKSLYWLDEPVQCSLKDFDFQYKLFSTVDPINISYEDSPYKLGEFKSGSGMIYSKIVSDTRLSDYTFVMNEINNLISISRKVNYNTALQDIIEEYTYKYSDDTNEWITYFFNGYDVEEKIKKIEAALAHYNEITEHNTPKAYKLPISSHESASDRIKRLYVNSKSYATLAKKIYTQLLRRVKYNEIGFYKVPTDDKYKKEVIPIQYISPLDRMQSRVNFILKRQWLLDRHILNALRDRLMTHNQINTENVEEDLISTISRIFGIDINESIEDDRYQDSIKILKQHYFKYEGLDSYDYEFLDDETKSWNYEDAVEYIAELNQYIKEFVGEDETTDESPQKKEPLTTIEKEWEDLYAKLLDGILSNTLEKNEYYKISSIAQELVQEYDFLIENKVFLETGKLNMKCKFVQSLKQELLKKIHAKDDDTKLELSTNFISEKKSEYLLLQDTIEHYPFIRALQDFDYKTLLYS
ncbi:hypothetical protein [Sulfurimonas xiamenensis]|uniref:Uncharacterized protein n=1 Tax=Sulfurimonas xiamenensis TaxID=2590021 RepID=A0AAJ4A2V6_9BACT|nr:hypothetical protein [Sulfurimonas xiamenensis]QFR42884.1 hypothetical protein FJR47_02745 [Sulfurimonas xiamenensis]